MKYDDASWHSGGDFPKSSPDEFGGTHIALLLKWCFIKGWAGDLHRQENAVDVEKLIRGEKSATEFLFQCCDGKLADEDLTAEGNAFIGVYYGDGGSYLTDYAEFFGDKMYVEDEARHDFRLFSGMVEKRYRAFINLKPARPFWKLW